MCVYMNVSVCVCACVYLGVRKLITFYQIRCEEKSSIQVNIMMKDVITSIFKGNPQIKKKKALQYLKLKYTTCFLNKTSSWSIYMNMKNLDRT